MYDHIAGAYNELHGDEQKRKLERLLMYINLKDYHTVVDVGCGTAHLAEYFTELNYFGIDPSQELLKQAPPETAVQQASGEEIPIPDNEVDLVLSLTALHNYDDPIAGVHELARVCNKTALIGVLRKADNHDEILSEIQDVFSIDQMFLDSHDTLIVASVRNV
jgi:ubiquinone/menaquinone biosynthesis C-methylase UbiE